MAELDFTRIEHLLNPDQLSGKRVTVVGLGSGGAPVCDHLTMSGVRVWDLYDMDTLDPVNLAKHPRLRKDVGRPKVEIQQEWILDRNPNAEVRSYSEDIILSETFRQSVQASDLVLACPDKKSVREFISDVCVKLMVPFVAASVFRTGIGGEVYAYIPDQTGCYRCLQLFSLTHEMNLTDDALGLTDEETTRIYGLGEREFRASGLSMDIQMICLIQARMALGILLMDTDTVLPPLKANWVIFGNRPAKGIFGKYFECKQMILRPQSYCNCQNGNSSREETHE